MGRPENFLITAFVLIFALALLSAMTPLLDQVTESLEFGIAVPFAGAVVLVLIAFAYSELIEGAE